MKNTMQLEPLTQDELMDVVGGEITTGTSFAHDFFYVVGVTIRSYYEFVTGAAAFQSSLPANLKR